jgi:hypothetical protein
MMGKQGRTDGDEAATQSKEPEGDNTAKQKKKQAHGRTNDNLKEKTATPSKEPEGDNTAKQKKEQVHGRTNNNLKEKKSSGNGARKRFQQFCRNQWIRNLRRRRSREKLINTAAFTFT